MRKLSRNSVIVTTHNNDLMRKAGNPARISDSGNDSLQKIIRMAYSRGLSRQQCINILEEFLVASRGRIKLMIELKQADETPARNIIFSYQ